MNLSTINFIVAGNWNPKIFKPQWLANILKETDKKIKINALFNIEKIEIGYDLGSFLIFPSDNFLKIDLKDKNTDNIKNTTIILLKILKLLCHTPITALGFNLVYEIDKNIDNTENKIINFLKNYKDHNIDNFNISEYRHTLNKDNYQINIISNVLINDKFKLTFNFQYNYNNFNKITIDSFVDKFNITKELLK